MASQGRKLVIIGLDGATFDVLEPYMKAGKLPGFSRLVKEGAWGNLASTMPPVTGPAWTSFMTGMSPAGHGIYDFVRRVEGSVSRRPITTRDFKAPTVWRYLTAAKKKVGLANIPITYPPPKVDGFAIPGMLTPVTEGEYAHPVGLMKELQDAIGDYVPDVPWQSYARWGMKGAEQFMADLMRCTTQRIKAFNHLMEHKTWDVFMGVFTETDRIQHFLWRYINPSPDRRLSAREKVLAEKVEGFYKALDDFLVGLMKKIEGKADLLIVSDHGFGPLDGTMYINRWLETQGHLAVQWGKVRMIYFKRWVFRMIRMLLGVRDVNQLRRMIGLRKRENNAAKMSTYFFLNCLDWDKTSLYACSRAEQAVHVNLKGREPRGSVAPGDEYERVRSAVLKDFASLRDPVTGDPLPVYVARREDLYKGDHVDDAPDVVTFVDEGRYVVDVKLTHKLFSKSGWLTGTGSHRYQGVLIAWGPSIARGKKLEGADIVDMTPTMLYQQGLPVPRYMEGKVLESLYADDFRKTNKPRYVEDGRLAAEGEEEGPLSAEDAARVEARLKGLGYM
jgi:predicted AlkP superfamily phosphohydrolase/phosphomutase